MASYRKYPLVMDYVIKKYMKEKKVRKKHKIINKTHKIYKDYIYEAPDIGGYDNFMSSNLYLAIAFFSFYEAMNRNIKPSEFNEFMDKLIPKKRQLLTSFINMNSKSVQSKLYQKLSNYKNKQEEMQSKDMWGNTWKININPYKKSKGVSFNLLSCPILDFAKKHNYLDIMPVLCNMDFLTVRLINGQLIRNGTLLDSDVCDYWYLGNKEKIE